MTQSTEILLIQNENLERKNCISGVSGRVASLRSVSAPAFQCYMFHMYVGVHAGGGIGDEIEDQQETSMRSTTPSLTSHSSSS